MECCLAWVSEAERSAATQVSNIHASVARSVDTASRPGLLSGFVFQL